MIQSLEMYTVKCDNCGKLFTDEHQGFVAWNSESSAWENASDSEWIRENEGKHYCPDCYSYDDDDKLILKEMKKITDDFSEELLWIKQLLPDRYICEPREKGVHCYDTTGEGINDDHMAHDKYDPETDNHWMLIVKAIEQKFGERLMEIYSQEPQYHSKFTVYIRPK